MNVGNRQLQTAVKTLILPVTATIILAHLNNVSTPIVTLYYIIQKNTNLQNGNIIFAVTNSNTIITS